MKFDNARRVNVEPFVLAQGGRITRVPTCGCVMLDGILRQGMALADQENRTFAARNVISPDVWHQHGVSFVYWVHCMYSSFAIIVPVWHAEAAERGRRATCA